MGEPGSRWRRTGAVALASVVLVATGCVGSIDRSEFDEIVRERGGGLSGDLVVAALAAIEARNDTSSLDVLQISFTSSTVAASVRSASFPDEVDGWTFTLGQDLNGPSPQPDIDPGAAVATFSDADVDVDTIEAAIDQAVAQTQVRGAWAESAFLRGTGGGSFELQVSITNDRSDETWVFDGDGNLKETR
jgi:hypothetical protein